MESNIKLQKEIKNLRRENHRLQKEINDLNEALDDNIEANKYMDADMEELEEQKEDLEKTLDNMVLKVTNLEEHFKAEICERIFDSFNLSQLTNIEELIFNLNKQLKK